MTQYTPQRLERVLVKLKERAQRYYRRECQPLIDQVIADKMTFDYVLPGSIEEHETAADVVARVQSGTEKLYYNRIWARGDSYLLGAKSDDETPQNLEFGARWFWVDLTWRRRRDRAFRVAELLEDALRPLLQIAEISQVFQVNGRMYLFDGERRWRGRVPLVIL